MTQMTVAEIVDETVQFYNENVNRRSIDDGGTCRYTDPHGRHCAIGRCLIDENFDASGSVSTIWNVGWDESGLSICKKLDLDLKEQYRGHTLPFWSDLQSFHDEFLAWNRHGITELGRDIANKIKRDHA